MNSVTLYNVWHHKLFDELYTDVKDFNGIIMYGVNTKYPKEYNKERGYNILFEWDLPLYDETFQKNGYCQTSCFYHIYVNGLHKNTKYIGFCQYDMKLYENIISDIENTISNGQTIFYDCGHTVAAEFLPRNGYCVPYEGSVLEQYNKYFQTSHAIDDLMKLNDEIKVPILHTFTIPSEMFDKMMKWFLNILDWIKTVHYHTEKACFTERIFALFLSLQFVENPNIQFKRMELKHIWPLYHNDTRWDNYKIVINTN